MTRVFCDGLSDLKLHAYLNPSKKLAASFQQIGSDRKVKVIFLRVVQPNLHLIAHFDIVKESRPNPGPFSLTFEFQRVEKCPLSVVEKYPILPAHFLELSLL